MKHNVRKWITLLLAVCMLFSLNGCKKEKTDVPDDLDLEAIYQAILNAQEDQKDELVMFPESVDGQYITSSYAGLSDISLKQQICYVAPISGFATEVVMVELEDNADVEAVKKIFQDRIDRAAADTLYTETADHWKNNAQVQSAGNYVCMIVLPDEYAIPEDVFSLTTE